MYTKNNVAGGENALMRNRKKLTRISEGAAVAALYVVLTWLSAEFGLSSGVPQCRLGEALSVLPLFMPAAVPGLTVGCFLANLFVSGGVAPLDVAVGTAATFLGACLCRLYGWWCGKYGFRNLVVATLPNALCNTFLLPPVLQYAYHIEEGYWLLALEIGAGELISGVVLGTALGKALPDKLKKRSTEDRKVRVKTEK